MRNAVIFSKSTTQIDALGRRMREIYIYKEGKTTQEQQKVQHLTSWISLFKNTVGFNLLTALAGSSPTKLGVVSLAAAKVINGAITGGKPGHRIFSSLSHLVMIFHKKGGLTAISHYIFFS